MGTAQTVEINLRDFSTLEIPNAGQTPRHLVLSPDDRVLYATTNKYNTVIATDTATRTIIGTVRTGTESRSMVISDDGTALYVVNYVSGTLQKIRTSDMTVLQTLDTGTRPVGITYDPELRRVWVANYAGSIWLYDDK
jgi:DNA-binding beta-propeller fold protein YncE